jgi:hypothetical protein
MRVLGWILLALPIVGVGTLIYLIEGLEGLLIVVGGTAGIVGCVQLGCRLLDR